MKSESALCRELLPRRYDIVLLLSVRSEERLAARESFVLEYEDALLLRKPRDAGLRSET